MSTIEFAYHPFEQVARTTRSGGGWLWLGVGLVLLAAVLLYANQTRQEESFTADYAG